MKKTILIVPIFIILSSFSVLASEGGPYTAGFNADSYDSTADSIPTPNQNQDEGGLVENDIYSAINALLGTSYTKNSQVDNFQYTKSDEIWKMTGTDENPAPVAVIGVGAGAWNSVRVYDINDATAKTDIFGGYFTGFGLTGDGSNANPFPAVYTPLANGTEFGWNLKSIGSSTNYFDSDPSRNADGFDHMITYNIPSLKGKTITLEYFDGSTQEYTFENPYLLAWEDLPYSNGKLGDEDYNDTILLVDRVVPVPEPMTMGLLASGLVGGLFLRRRKTC